ncbi:MAG: FHA domain-containing protein [Okeania sp. SIO3B5]|uniref:FHA domain-containing protein n=1 Tax=Okeania sp. SIO3B5 TaxID=2607811 RepID=UPI0013FF5B0F|nr:FHA domain-containing protein [Okeania sp. SIO3B5]NEO54810.1 FHA domain-containing protein [Okeania sp. SIO3B5]
MSITCETCGYDSNPADAEYCEACGAELKSMPPTMIQTNPTISSPEIIPMTPPGPGLEPPSPIPTPPAPTTTPPAISTPLAKTTISPVIPTPPAATTTSPARLVAKQVNAPEAEFPLKAVAVVGVFDPDSGPVDIDLESFAGGDTVSRLHAEIYPEFGQWMVKDLGSLNGVFIKPSGQTRFGARITTPMSLNPGDEVAFGKVQFVFQQQQVMYLE